MPPVTDSTPGAARSRFSGLNRARVQDLNLSSLTRRGAGHVRPIQNTLLFDFGALASKLEHVHMSRGAHDVGIPVNVMSASASKPYKSNTPSTVIDRPPSPCLKQPHCSRTVRPSQHTLTSL